MKKTLLLIILSIILNSCKISQDLIKYDNQLGLYKYEAGKNISYPLRNKKGKNIDLLNITNFKKELDSLKNRYPLNKRIELNDKIKSSDTEIAHLYSEVNKNIKERKFVLAEQNIKQLKIIYPEIIKYSDCSFLEAYIYEQTNRPEEAKDKHLEFIQFSSAKYSDRFRGYRDLDTNDSLFSLQRNISKKYIKTGLGNFKQSFLTDLQPKYYYNSYQPGFNLNPEDISRYRSKSKGSVYINLGIDYGNSLGISIQPYFKLNKYFDINAWTTITSHNQDLGLAIPIQLYKSSSNNFGIKISPFINTVSAKKVTIDEIDYEIDDNILNFGAKFSIGYYFNEKFSLGSYYKYNSKNSENPHLTYDDNIKIWFENEYDISLYYNIYKKINLKAGIKNDDPVVGFYLSNWELSYNISNSEFIAKFELF